MKPEKRVTAAVEKAQEILAQYVEPGPRNCETAINELMDAHRNLGRGEKWTI
jgi:hypothetical protein